MRACASYGGGVENSLRYISLCTTRYNTGGQYLSRREARAHILPGRGIHTRRASRPYMNKLQVGFSKEIELPKGGCLLIADEMPDVLRSRVFDPSKHSFNPLQHLDYRKAREIADILYTASPQGENTLTVRNGKRALLHLLMERPGRFDTIKPNGKDDATKEAMAAIGDILISPILRNVLCKPTNFSFNPRSTILARINRAELGDFDALLLGLFLMAHYKGQIVLPDGGFYLREMHTTLIRQDRLIVGIDTLQELPPRLRQAVLLIGEKTGSGTTFDDAATLGQYAGLTTGTNAFNDFVYRSMKR